jgi:hypothetical protein
VYRQWATNAQSVKKIAASPYDAAIYDALGTAVRKVAGQELDAATAL